VRVTDLRGYLRSLDAETLAELLHEQAERDPELHARLQLRAGGEPTDLLDRQAGSGEATKIVAVLDTLQRLLDAGTQADLAPLARRTVDRIVKAQQDDPAVLRRAVALYARACTARPPADLAGWIASLTLDHGVDVELSGFARALGDKGLAHLKSIVDKQPGRVAEQLTEQLAEISGDVDALLEILSRQPQRLDVRLKIVRVLRDAGRTAEAVAYAARALNHTDEDALTSCRAEFRRTPTEKTFLAIREAAVELGRWETERESALAVLRERAEGDEAGADELVRALLAEERPDEAWQAARQCHPSLPVLLQVAELREQTHPTEVLDVYKLHVNHLIEQKDAAHYEQAAKRLRKIRQLYRKAGSPAEFGPYLGALVTTHKRKARLIAEIRQARIALPKG
jgi:tetratricopeptide (TPR) repeat protein